MMRRLTGIYGQQIKKLVGMLTPNILSADKNNDFFFRIFETLMHMTLSAETMNK